MQIKAFRQYSDRRRFDFVGNTYKEAISSLLSAKQLINVLSLLGEFSCKYWEPWIFHDLFFCQLAAASKVRHDLCVTLCKEMEDSLGFWIPRSGFRIPDNKFRIPCKWNLDSGFQSLAGFRISWAEFRIPKSRIYNSTRTNSRMILDSTSKISRIPEFGLRYMEWCVP